MAISRTHTWSAGEVLLASDLNAEFNGILNNAADLVSPFTKAISMGGFSLNFDAANTMSLTSSTKGLNLSSTTAINDVFTTVASATTPDIWTSVGGVVNYTGVATATGFVAAPQAGAKRKLVCSGAAVFTAGANVLIAGVSSGSNYTAAADDVVDVIALTTTQFLLIPLRYSGAPISVTGTDGQALSASSAATPYGVAYIDNPSRPNLLINPNWQIDQINEGALYTVNATAVNGPDGWSGDTVGAGVFKVRTLADPDDASQKCLEITCTTADAAIAATDTYSIYTAIEGYDASALRLGTSGAQPLTIQFKFKTNVTGVYGVSLANSAKNRSYYGIITVADSSEHEYSISLTGDTAGTWLYTSGVGLYLRLTLSAGSNFQGTAGAWAADAKTTTAAQCNFMSANTNVAYLKRIQLIPGALVQAYKPADLQKELAKAQRYYEKTYPQGTAPGASTTAGMIGTAAQSSAATNVSFTPQFKVEKRANPTINSWSSTGGSGNFSTMTAGSGIASDNVASAVGSDVSTRGLTISNITTATTSMAIHLTANARLS